MNPHALPLENPVLRVRKIISWNDSQPLCTPGKTLLGADLQSKRKEKYGNAIR